MTHRVLIGAFESVPAGLYQMARAGAQLAKLPKKDGTVEIRIASDPAASMGAVDVPPVFSSMLSESFPAL